MMIFDIQRFSTHDGPGIRTVVFFKGCTLHCTWCENPESQDFKPELLYNQKDCIGCLSCLNVAHEGSVQAGVDGKIVVARNIVPPILLGSVCSTKALRVAGKNASTSEIMTEVLKDRNFYIKSGGGLTISGGEPLAQIDAMRELVETAKIEGIDVVVESALAVNRTNIEYVLDLPIHWLVDLKHIDPERFREGTGGDASLVLKNIRYLSENGADLTIRVPIIPGFNDDETAIRLIFDFIKSLNNLNGSSTTLVRRVDLLPYHDLAAGKFAALGRHYSYPLGLRVKNEFIDFCAKIGRSLGLDIKIGG
jgi:pyruvate formate lyase activating enzyme